MKTYSELVQLKTFHERLDYLRLIGSIGRSTFGYDRYLNQKFYSSREWREIRDFVIMRDNGCDLGIENYEIYTGLHVHHMNPLTPKLVRERAPMVLDPENLVTTSRDTHTAIHYGGGEDLWPELVERAPGDTKLW